MQASPVASRVTARRAALTGSGMRCVGVRGFREAAFLRSTGSRCARNRSKGAV